MNKKFLAGLVGVASLGLLVAGATPQVMAHGRRHTGDDDGLRRASRLFDDHGLSHREDRRNDRRFDRRNDRREDRRLDRKIEARHGVNHVHGVNHR